LFMAVFLAFQWIIVGIMTIKLTVFNRH
jgi:hypothetical protein